MLLSCEMGLSPYNSESPQFWIMKLWEALDMCQTMFGVTTSQPHASDVF